MSGDGMHSDVVGGRVNRPSTPTNCMDGIVRRSLDDSVRTKSDSGPWRSVDMTKYC